ncbi:MAG: thiamine-phosphate kinase [Candidatus Hydrogenedentes bacterium]|nr:thiamine-phosphate kinase [Candidatus Hydrogenedentota bacterium]
MKIEEIGEFTLIEKIAKLVEDKIDESVLVSLGDDCGVVKVGGRVLLFSTDMSVERVHFLDEKFPSSAIGWKSVMSAWSDIASMGGIPRWALVSWALPPKTSVGKALSIYRGMVEACNFVGGFILGGDTVSSDRIVIDVTVIGECCSGGYVTRKGAKVGDIVAITGTLGNSLAGLLALEKNFPEPYFWRTHWYPIPRIEEGKWLCKNNYVNTMIDISDGLLADAKHIAEASNIGINIETTKISVGQRLKRFCETYGFEPIEIFLQSGEEYELLVTISEDIWHRVKEEFESRFECGLFEIGRVTDRWLGVRVDGEEPCLKGYEHFKTQ